MCVQCRFWFTRVDWCILHLIIVASAHVTHVTQDLKMCQHSAISIFFIPLFIWILDLYFNKCIGYNARTSPIIVINAKESIKPILWFSACLPQAITWQPCMPRQTERVDIVRNAICHLHLLHTCRSGSFLQQISMDFTTEKMHLTWIPAFPNESV